MREYWGTRQIKVRSLPIVINPKSQCPMGHSDSKIMILEPELHLRICKCECLYCLKCFGYESTVNFGNKVNF